MKKKKQNSPRRDSNPQSLPPEGSALSIRPQERTRTKEKKNIKKQPAGGIEPPIYRLRSGCLATWPYRRLRIFVDVCKFGRVVKALALGASLERGTGSNPVACNFFFRLWIQQKKKKKKKKKIHVMNFCKKKTKNCFLKPITKKMSPFPTGGKGDIFFCDFCCLFNFLFLIFFDWQFWKFFFGMVFIVPKKKKMYMNKKQMGKKKFEHRDWKIGGKKKIPKGSIFFSFVFFLFDLGNIF